MKIYVCGPMTGRAFHNFPAFFSAEKALVGKGYDVVNPAKNDGGSTWQRSWQLTVDANRSWESYLRQDLTSMLTCDAIYTLPGWRKSRGARLEVNVAKRLGMEFVTL